MKQRQRARQADERVQRLSPWAQRIWAERYCYRGTQAAPERSIEDSWQRVARALAANEPSARHRWQAEFRAACEDFRLLPAGRILAGAGTTGPVTLSNCFVMDTIVDSTPGIFGALAEGALTMQYGGGVGFDFSTLRPHAARPRDGGPGAPGVVAWMKVWDQTCATVLTGARRGAMMATLRCDHPEIEAFIAAKRMPGTLTRFNLSVLVSDAFMRAVARDAEWPLLFPAAGLAGDGRTLARTWPGHTGRVSCRVFATVRARTLWQRLVRASYDSAEPGVLFIDRINRENNLRYCETIAATNPCGELPLPPYGACNLASINLTRFVVNPFSARAAIDFTALADSVGIAVRMLDNVVDVSRYPLAQQHRRALDTRRVGLGVTGLADALIMLGHAYGSDAGRDAATAIARCLRDTAYWSSVALAREKGAFPRFERDPYLAAPFVHRLPGALRDAIARHGIRNSHLLALAPAGTISLLAGNVSSGIEPVFAARYTRRIRMRDGHARDYVIDDYACREWRRGRRRGLPPAFADITSLSPHAQLSMQAALQPLIDNAISKTVNVPADYTLQEFSRLFTRACELGLKGVTAFRPGHLRDAVLSCPVQG